MPNLTNAQIPTITTLEQLIVYACSAYDLVYSTPKIIFAKDDGGRVYLPLIQGDYNRVDADGLRYNIFTIAIKMDPNVIGGTNKLWTYALPYANVGMPASHLAS